MSKNNDEHIGGPGIDTQYERDAINYRPNLDWERSEINSGWGNRPSESIKEKSVDEFTQPGTRDLWNKFVSIVEQLDSLDNELSGRLHNTDAPIPETLRPDVQEAAKRYGQTVEQKIPFTLYKEALKSKDSHEKQIITDVYEGYHADVHGNILAEVYPDVAEMRQDWGDMFGFLNKGVFAQLVDEKSLPKNISREEESINLVEEKEMGLINQFNKLTLELDDANESVRKAYMAGPDSKEYFNELRKANRLEKAIANIERRMHTKKQAIDLSQSKANRALGNIEMINISINIDHYKGERKAILLPLLSQYATGQSMENGLRKLQALLKLSVDGKNSDISDMKANLRNLSGRENRKRINNALVNGVHMRNEVSGSVFDALSSMDDTSDSFGFNRVAEHIMDSVNVSRGLYKDNAGDFYKMHTMESELRSDKLGSLLNKDSAREIYKLLDKLIIYGRERGSWPTQKDLSSWIDNFLASQKLS